MQFIYDDGGRAAAGYTGSTGDCVCRAIAIALEKPYQEVYLGLNNFRYTLKQTRKVKGSHARTGVHRKVYDKFLKDRGWIFHPTMAIGQGCKVHLRAEELPKGRIIVRLSKHLAAVIDGVIHDTFSDTRGGTRCVYGYYAKAS